MSGVIWWVGAIHVAAYSLAGTAFVVVWTANKAVFKAGIGGKMMRAYLEYLRTKKAAATPTTDQGDAG